ncbi:hypothetical protein L211DRAFT_852764 [Terfezia boudieri ATCC MYA-4762]|uniref:Uncharacterized protein n=1 Tax=Terfezia boudieri ATCC MYA-4762 TaxID=1051890 RepID=A0A3N4LEU6_9PEZI|nr:hypothetical protein L211DRAFT_852764 [Terfezia boudieri ATCC MYA-4762]
MSLAENLEDHSTLHGSSIAEISSLLNYLESTPADTIATTLCWRASNRPNAIPLSKRVSMLTALTRFLLGLHPVEPIPESMTVDGKDMWINVQKLKRNHERYVLQKAKYKGYRWVGEANIWAVEKCEQIQRSWFEKTVDMRWVANKAEVDQNKEESHRDVGRFTRDPKDLRKGS